MRRSILGLVVVASVVLSAGQASAVAFQPGLYVTATTDWNFNNRLLRVDPSGTYSTAISFPDHVVPIGLAFYDGNRLGVTFGAGGVYQGTYKILDSQGTSLASYSPIPQTNNPGNGAWGVGIAIDTDGTAYIATHNTPGATKITATGQVSDWTGYNYGLWWGKDATIAPNGNLYMAHGLGVPERHNFTIDEINKTTGAVTTILDNLDWTMGLAFNAAGDMYFSQYRLNQVWKLSAGATVPTLSATVPNPAYMTMGPDGNLYVIGSQSDTRNQIWQVDTTTGNSTLYADNLPYLVDIAFAPVPEPSSLLLLVMGSISLLAAAWRRRQRLASMILAAAVVLVVAGNAHAVAFQNGLYTNSNGGGSILRIDPDGSHTTVLSFSNAATDSPTGLGFYDQNRLAVTFGGPYGSFRVFDSGGNTLTTINNIPRTNQYWYCCGAGFVIDTDGTAYIPTHNSPGATKITADGTVSDWTGYVYDFWWGKNAAISPTTGKLYMTHGLEQEDRHATFTISELNKTTGAFTHVLTGLDWTVGIAFGSDGDMYFSQNSLGRICKMEEGSTTYSVLASVPYAMGMTMGADGYLYTIGRVSETRYQVYKTNVDTGTSMLYADNLPYITRLAFAPVPEPSALVLLGVGAISLLAYAWRRRGISMRRSILGLLVVASVVLSAGQVRAAEWMYWTDAGSVYRAKTDGSNLAKIYNGSVVDGNTLYIDVDAAAGKLYQYGRVGTSSASAGYVRRSNLDGTGTEGIITTGLTNYNLYGFALDTTNGKMYLGSHMGMQKANIDGSSLTSLPISPYYPLDIQVDAANAKLYYTSAVNYNGIRRVNLDGSSTQNVLNLGGGDFGSTQIALDVAQGRLFYTQYGSQTIGKVNLDGSGITTLLSGIQALDIELDADAAKLYWITSNTIQRSNLDGSGHENVMTLAVPDARSLLLTNVPEPSTLALLGVGAISLLAYAWRRRQRLPSMVLVVATAVSFGTGANQLHAGIYWTEYGTVYRANLDGSQKTLVYPASLVNGYVCGLAIDTTNEKLYTYGRSDPTTVDAGHGFVSRMNLDGSNPEQLITAGLGTITYGFALDVANNKMYMSEHRQVRQANMDGSGLHDLPLGLYYAGELDVDNERLYFDESLSFEGVASSNLEGLDVERIYTGSASSFALDSLGEQIYIASGVWGGNQTIKRMNLNGTGLTSLVSGLLYTASLEVDIPGGKMYWMTNTEIQRANLDGSGVERLVLLGGSGPLGKEDMILGPIPEPSALVLLGIGAISLLAYAWRRWGISMRRSILGLLVAAATMAAGTAQAVVHSGDIIVADANALGGTGAIFAVNPQTGVQSVVSSGGYFSDPWGLTIDNNRDILVTDRVSKKILRVDPQSGAQSVISQDGWGNPMDIIVNKSGDMFVLDTDNPQYGRSVFRVNRTDGSKTIITSSGFSGDVSYGLALDNNGQLLLGNRGTQAGWWFKDGSILQVDPLTGQQTVISQYGQLGNPDDLVMSPSGDIYAVDGGVGANHWGGVIKINATTGQQTVISSDGYFGTCPQGIDLAPNGDLFVVDYNSFGGFGAVLRIDPSTGNQSVVSNYGYFVEPSRLAVYPVPEPSTLALLGIGAISLLAYAWRRRGGMSMRRSILGLLVVASVVLSAGQVRAAEWMYWADAGSVYRAQTDGSNLATIYNGNAADGNTWFIDIDASTAKLYQYGIVGPSNASVGYLRRSNLDGTGTESIIATGLSSILYGFALDTANGKMYLGRHMGMQQANIDGSSLTSLPISPYYPHDIQVDAANANLYYTSAVDYNGIRKANLDGNNAQNVLNLGWGDSVSTHIALDVAQGRLFYTQYGSQTIGKMNLDGSGITTLLSGIQAFDIELDADAGKLYWTTASKIQRSNLDGSKLEDVVTLAVPGYGCADSLILTTVPEPSSLLLLGIGALGLLAYAWRRRG